jgi:hypothetical protein
MVRETLSLPWLRVSVAADTPEAMDQVRRGVKKFAIGADGRPFRLAIHAELDHPGEQPADARTIWERANTRFQFVAGIAGGAESRFATEDGSVVTLDHAAGTVRLRLRREVFAALYSTWVDLLAAPLAEHWRECGCFPLHAAAIDISGWRPSALPGRPRGC